MRELPSIGMIAVIWVDLHGKTFTGIFRRGRQPYVEGTNRVNSRVRVKDYAPSWRTTQVRKRMDAEIEAQKAVYAQQIGRANRFLTPADVAERHKADLAEAAKVSVKVITARACEFCGAGPADKCRRVFCAFGEHID